MGCCLAKGLWNPFLGWVDPLGWAELYSEVLPSASFNRHLTQVPGGFTCLNLPPTPQLLSNPFIFYIFISSTPTPTAIICGLG